jgi:hypothetical protein
MRRILFLLFHLVLFKFQTQAQNSIGLFVGAHASRFQRIEGTDAIDFDSRTTVNFGAIFDMRINSQFSIQTELGYLLMTGRMNNHLADPEPFVYDLSINYLVLPALIKWKFGTDQFKFFILCGPRLGLGLGEVTLDIFNTTYDIPYDQTAFRRFEFGLEFGGGIIFKMGHGDFIINVRNYQSLIDLNTHYQPFGVFEGCIVQNYSLGINLGYLFHIGIQN